MTVNVTSPVTGGAQTGFTAPTYTIVVDLAPDVNAKQYAVTALGGTQAGVTVHSGSSPFTTTFFRPKVYRLIGAPNPVTGVVSNVPMNNYKLLTRKGMIPLAGQSSRTGMIESTISIPAGADLASPAEIRAMLAMHIGVLQQISAGLGDTAVSGLS